MSEMQQTNGAEEFKNVKVKKAVAATTTIDRVSKLLGAHNETDRKAILNFLNATFGAAVQ